MAVSAVNKAVIPAAGLGTRFLPATKATPKEMIPLVDKPGIQYVVEEALRAGISDLLIIVGRGKRTIEDHFDRLPELEEALTRAGKTDQAAEVRHLAEMVNVHFVRQGEPRGLGHAIGVARHHVGDEPFAVLLPDDLMDESATVLTDMVAAHERTGASVIALKEFPPSEISAYGVVVPAAPPDEHGLVRLAGMVEKPPASEAPSSLAIMGRYLLTPEIFDCIDRVEPGRGGEIQITDAMALLLDKQPIYGLPFTEGRYDTGNKLDWLRATVELGLRHPELGSGFRQALAEICRREQIV